MILSETAVQAPRMLFANAIVGNAFRTMGDTGARARCHADTMILALYTRCGCDTVRTMPRAPFQILVLPCRHDGERWLFAIFHRSDADVWQGIAGGGEDNETPIQAAAREATEEAGISAGTPLLPLDTTASIRADCFPSADWGDGTYVVREHSFGVMVDGERLVLSDEHRACFWLDADAAMARVTFDSNATAIWELHQRLLRDAGMRGR